MAREQRRLAAIVAADVVGYSRLIGADEAGTLAQLRTLRHDLIDPSIATHGGRIVKTTGDGLLIEFGSVVDAMRCAVALQREMAQRDTDLSEDRRIAFRVGIHMGDIVVDSNDILGDGVNVAARLEALAEAGGICVSGRVQEDLAGKLDIELRDGGEQTLKNIARPVRVWHWSPHAIAATASQSPSNTRPSLPDKPSIAVLPFLNMSGNPDQEYFADGVTEDIITELARYRSILVIARNSTFTYKGKAVDVRTVGRELGVRYLLEGSVRRAGDKVRTTAQLTDAATGGHIWAERYDRALVDVFALQDDITKRIVAHLHPALVETEIELARRRPSQSVTAWDLYLQALPLTRSYDRSQVEQAEQLLRRAIEAKPDFAAAFAKLSSCRLKAHYYEWSEPLAARAEALELAGRAVELDREEALAYDALASAQLRATRVVEALSAARRALDLSPILMAAHGTLISALAFCGRCDEAIAAYKESEYLSPRDPDRSGRLMGLLLANFFAGNYPETVRLAREHALLQPHWFGNQSFLAASLAHLGRLEEARVAVRRLLELKPSYSIPRMEPSGPSMIQRPEDKIRLVDGLRMAGVPERQV